MDLRITKPKTVAAALKPFKVALADLQAVVKAKRLVVSNGADNEGMKCPFHDAHSIDGGCVRCWKNRKHRENSLLPVSWQAIRSSARELG